MSEPHIVYQPLTKIFVIIVGLPKQRKSRNQENNIGNPTVQHNETGRQDLGKRISCRRAGLPAESDLPPTLAPG